MHHALCADKVFLYIDFISEQDLRAVVEKTAKFLEKPIKSNEEMEKLLNHLSFSSMKANPYLNNEELAKERSRFLGQEKKSDFVRKGKVGSWKTELSTESIKLLQDWVEEKKIFGFLS
jgi:hypothetical protein